MRKDGRLRRPLAWLESRAPAIHAFLISDEKPKPAIREAIGGFLVLLLLVTVLWGATGQPLNRSPVVVIESGSMMRCDQGLHGGIPSSVCEGSFGRLGTIDPGDLVFVRNTDGGKDIQAAAACLEAGDRNRYGFCGDTIIYRPGGSTTATPIIHRAMVYLVPYADGTFDVPACDLERADRPTVAQEPCVRAGMDGLSLDELLRQYTEVHPYQDYGPERAGFVTLGDNNPGIDQGSSILGGDWSLVQPEWILGKARGELPWLGLLKLFVTDAVGPTNNYAQAPGDTKFLMWFTLAVLIGGPTVYETVIKKRRLAKEGEEEGPES